MKIKHAWMPRILSTDGTVLHSGAMWSEFAPSKNPATYLVDENDPLMDIAGDHPLRVKGVSVKGADIVIDHRDALRFQTVMTGSAAVGSGAWVILVEP